MTSKTDPTPYHHGNLREALLRRAAEVIEADGIARLSLRALARDLGVSHGAPARHFKSRNDILRTLATEGYAQVTKATLAAIAEAGDDPLRRLNAMGKAYVHWSLDHQALYHTIVHPEVSRQADEALIGAMTKFMEEVSKAVMEAQSAGWHQNSAHSIALQYAIMSVSGIAFNLSNDLYTSVFGVQNHAMADKLIDLAVPVK